MEYKNKKIREIHVMVNNKPETKLKKLHSCYSRSPRTRGFSYSYFNKQSYSDYESSIRLKGKEIEN